MSAPWNRRLVVGAAALTIFLAMLDASIVNVALPAIGADLGVDPARSQWVVLGYLLAVAAVVLPAGRWLDSVGRRSAFIFAIGGFAASGIARSLPFSGGPLLATTAWAVSGYEPSGMRIGLAVALCGAAALLGQASFTPATARNGPSHHQSPAAIKP
jgi:MFS family permease